MKKLLLLTLISLPFISIAQDSLKVKGDFQVNGSVSGGNVNRQLFGITTEFIAEKKSIALTTNPSFLYGTSSGVIKETEYFQTLAFHKNVSKMLKMLMFIDVEHSHLRRIQSREDIGEGVSMKIVDKKNFMFYFSEAAVIEKTHPWGITDSFDIITCRASSRIKINVKFTNPNFADIKLTVISLIQPAFMQTKITNDLVKVPLYQNFSSRTTVSLEKPMFNRINIGLICSYITQTYTSYLSQHKEYNWQPGFSYKPYDYNIQFLVKCFL